MTFTKIRAVFLPLAVSLGLAITTPALAGPAQENIMSQYAEQAGTDPAWTGAFSAKRGAAFFHASPATGKPDTPSCTSCHGNSPLQGGKTRAGKAIEPMALSKTPTRYSDLEKVEKWFLRNCNSVLGRPCTPLEKGDFLTFMAGQ